MHSIITDYGRQTKEITDAEWDTTYGRVSRHDQYFTRAVQERDVVRYSHYGWQRDHSLARQAWNIAAKRPFPDATSHYIEIGNQEHEMELRGRCPHP
jgi:hypothetical protein